MKDIIMEIVGYLVAALFGGGSGWLFTRKAKKVEIEQKEAEIAKLKTSSSQSIMDQYQEALDDLEKRYEKRSKYMEKEYERRHADLHLDYERKIKMIKDEKDAEIEMLKKRVNRLSGKLNYWQNKYQEKE
jgi:hypothetical protein